MYVCMYITKTETGIDMATRRADDIYRRPNMCYSHRCT